MPPRGTSRRLQRALADFGADHAFAAAARKVQEHYGVSVPVARVRTVTLQHAHVLAAQAPQPVRTLPAHGAERIVAEADGTMLPIVDPSDAPPGADRRKFRQVHDQEARLTAARAQGSATTHYGATLHDVADTGLRWAQGVRVAGWGLHSQIHAVGDGAPWIAEQARVQFGAQGRSTLDLYHACDYLAAATPDPAHAKLFVAPLREGPPRQRAPPRPRHAAPARGAARLPGRKSPRARGAALLGHRTAQLDYAHALAHDLPVGSGLIESGHKHVLQARLKQAGAWWTEINAHALCQLRTLRANLQWDKYWQN